MTKIGILGAGQLGRMMALAGLPLGMQFSLYDTSGTPSAGLGHIFSDPDNTQEELQHFLDSVDVVTYEFEHLPLDLANNIARQKPLYPGVDALKVCQNREYEKALFTKLDIPTPDYRVVNSARELKEAVQELSCPVVAKSITEGYDGKGQAVIKSPQDSESAWKTIGHNKLIVESFVKFRREISIIAARNIHGDMVFYPIVENIHDGGILSYTLAPAPGLDKKFEAKAIEYIQRLLKQLNYVGVLALELFETESELLANEMAPRVHNSGHWSMNGAHTSQFENHLRAVTGLPLGDTEAIGVTCMINIVGKNIQREGVLSLNDTHLHLYNKTERVSRKLGHINVVATNFPTLFQKVEQCLNFVPDHSPFGIESS